MVDIQASNAKLIDRGARIIMEVAGTDYATAQTALECADGSAKTAIVMLVKGIDRREAVALLEKNDGFLRRVLEDAS
jgi:N-acetylmuramic acid 6-phosphate etherase